MTEKIAIQETYGEKYQHCWGCGVKNEEGLHLKSYPTEDGKEVICKVKPDKMYTGGVPFNLFGGMIAMLFDCHGTASAAYFNHHSQGLELTKDTVIQRYITARLEVDFKKTNPNGRRNHHKIKPSRTRRKKSHNRNDPRSKRRNKSQSRNGSSKNKRPIKR